MTYRNQVTGKRVDDRPLKGWEVTSIDPPMTEPGMRSMTLGPRGRLIFLAALGAPAEAEAGDAPPTWGQVFAAAGLDRDSFTEVEPVHLPPVASDRHLAWTGSYPEEPDWPLRIEAASLSGVPVWFQQFGPWNAADQQIFAER